MFRNKNLLKIFLSIVLVFHVAVAGAQPVAFPGMAWKIRAGTTLPTTDCDATSEAGRVFIDTNATTGQQFYVCEGASGWALQGDGVGSGDIEGVTAGDGISGGGTSGTVTVATASDEADFLLSGALTCGASTQGKAQVHTTPLQYCDNAATPTLRYAAYGSSTGVATSATALAANGANCTTGNYPLGVDASGAVESCTALTVYAPADADYLVGTANGSLSAEIVVGTTPGGELGGTWGSPTLDDSVTVTGWVMGTFSATQLTSPTVLIDLLDGVGAVDMDYGSADITDHTFTSDGGTVILDGSVAASAGVNLGTSQALIGTTAMTIGNNGQTVAVNSSDWDIDATGIATGMGNITSNGIVTADAFVSDVSDPADAGVVRLGNAENIAWEASPAGTDVTIGLDSSEVVQISSSATVTGTMAATTVTGANVTSGANPGHTHTGSSLSGVDVSDDTNLAVSGSLLNLTGDTLNVREGTLTDENICNYESTGTLLECALAPTDDSVLLGNGTAFAVKSVPNCNGIGNYLSYDSSTNTFSCVTSDPVAEPFDFGLINAPSGTDPEADTTHDTLNLTAGTAMILTGTATTDTLDVAFDPTAALNISGAWEIQDDIDFQFGNDADWKVQYDEGVDNQLLFLTANTAAVATTDPMFEILVGATPTADQEVFGVAKGTQASNTSLFTVDEDGDVKANNSGSVVYFNHAHSRPTRAIGTVYQNTTGHPIWVYGSLKCIAYDSAAATDNVAYITVKTDSSTPPTTAVQKSGILIMTALAGIATTYQELHDVFAFVVQDQDYYTLTLTNVGAATCTLDPANWSEVDF